MYFIYRITNKIDANTYVGYTSRSPEERFKQHCRSANSGSLVCTKLYNAMRKYGIQNFSVDVLKEGSNNTIGLCVDEPQYISKLKPEYNITSGGNGIIRHSSNSRVRISTSKLGSKNPMFGKVGTFTGKRHTQSSIDKIVQARSKQIIPKDKKYGRVGSWNKINSTKLTCPHCNISASLGNSIRWHFNNCRRLKNGRIGISSASIGFLE